MTPRRIFIGFDSRQIISYTALSTSIISQASVPVTIAPVSAMTTGLRRKGLTPFTWARFLVPHLCDYKGWALFLDADMLALADIEDLFKMADDKYAVMVSKNKMKFEWASLMLFNCGHPDNAVLTPEYIEKTDGLHAIGWTENVGGILGEWNHLVGYDRPDPTAKLVHFTQGVPLFPETRDSEYADEWLATMNVATSALSWAELMAHSVHAKPVYERLAGGPVLCPLCNEKLVRIEHEGGKRKAIYGCGHVALEGTVNGGAGHSDIRPS